MNPVIFAQQMMMARSQAGGDTYWNDVLSLCYYQGADGSTSILDEVSGASWVANGSAALRTAQAKFGTSSLRLPGSTGSYVASGNPASYWAPFNTSLASWSLDIWLRADAITTSSQVVYDMGGVATNLTGTALLIDATGKLDFVWAHSFSGGYLCRIQQGAVAPNTWTLATICFDVTGSIGGTVHLFQDGTLIGSAALGSGATDNSPANAPDFGRYHGGNSLYFAGYIGEFRATAGVCRHTASFTPDATQWPNHA